MSTTTFDVGQRVELNDSRVGTIRFVGNTDFQVGEWVGVELDDAEGKNDGAVKGRRYFTCPAEHGIFLRPSGINRVLEEARPKAKATSNGAAVKGRPSSVSASGINGARRQTLQSAMDRRTSTIGDNSPTPSSRLTVSGIRSPTKSPTKHLATNGAVSTSSTRTSTPTAVGQRPGVASSRSRPSLTPATALSGRRTSVVPPSTATSNQRTSRSSLAPPSSSRTSTSRVTPGPTKSARPAPQQQQLEQRERLSSTTEETTGDEDAEQPDVASSRESEESSANDEGGTEAEEELEEDTPRPNFAPPPVPPIPPDPVERTTRNRRPSSPTAASIHSQRTIRSTATNRQIEELETKLRVSERQRAEDREVKQKLEKAVQERDQFKGVIEKLQNKYRPQQQEMERLRKELADKETQVVSIEELKADHEHAMESALLDREVAEETAEGLKAELEILRANNEEMKLELEILQEENGELSKEMSPEERSSAGWLQLEKSNDRLKNALLSLRDFAQEKEAELKEQIDELEAEVKESEPLRSQLDDTKEKLLRAQADTEDLRQQLEAADTAEDMIETLTEDVHNMREKIAELRSVIEDLENLKELNDELEINHVEAEKQMQEEMDFKDSLLLDRERTAKEQQAALDEADYNIGRFRALVGQLQSDLQDLEASKQISETEAAELSSKSRAMVDLNIKLQSSAAKTQVKTLDLELRKLDAQQASENLEIVQLFLPETFESERDSVLALLRFKRIAFKANLVQSFVQERIASFGHRGSRDEDIFAACETYDKLTWVAAMAECFVKSASGRNMEDFGRYGNAFYELSVVERTLDDFVDGLRREEVREEEMNVRFGRCIEVMNHLADQHHVHESAADRADELLMKTTCLQSRLQSAISALALTKTMIEGSLGCTNNDEESEDDSASDTTLILQRMKTIIEHARNAKVVSGKTHRALSDLQARSLMLEASLAEQFEDAAAVASQIAIYTYQIGAALQSLFGEEDRIDCVSPSEIAAVLSRLATEIFALPNQEPGPFVALIARLRSLSVMLAELSALPTDLDNTVEFERAPAPWIARADELKTRKITSIDTEAELARTVETIRERDALLKTKETELEEQSVRIEMLEARMKDASKRSARIGELERTLHEAKDREAKAKTDLAKARQDAQLDVERVREDMARLASERGNSSGGHDIDGDVMGAQARVLMQRQEHKISGLEGAVRYLTEENHRLRLPAPDAPRVVLSTLDWLHAPLQPCKTSRRKQQDALQRRGEKVLEDMLALASRARMVDLTSMPENKLAWRSAKESSRWQVERRNEEWAMWKHGRHDVIRNAGRINAS